MAGAELGQGSSIGAKIEGLCSFCHVLIVVLMQTVVMTASVVVRTAMNIGKCERERANSVFVGLCTLLSSPVLARLCCAVQSCPLPAHYLSMVSVRVCNYRCL